MCCLDRVRMIGKRSSQRNKTITKLKCIKITCSGLSLMEKKKEKKDVARFLKYF